VFLLYEYERCLTVAGFTNDGNIRVHPERARVEPSGVRIVVHDDDRH